MDKTVIVTGASAGIGAAAARKFAKAGATVAVVGRSTEKTTAVAREIGAKPYLVDFARLADVRRLADDLRADFPVIDVLAHNAGLAPGKPSLTEDGYEKTFQVNYLAPFLLTNLLWDRLTASPDARVISTSSMAHRFGRIDLANLSGLPARYTTTRVYGTWKLGNILFTRELARRAKGTSITASAFHPGPVASEFFREDPVMRRIVTSRLGKAVLVTPDQGADPMLHLATVADAQSVNGAYFHRMKRREPKGVGRELERELWDRSAALLGISDQADR